jgi:DNA-binding MarR family transcriptional regulator
MAQMLARMERDGVIERAPDPADGRASLVSLTRRSRARLPRGKAALMQGERDATAGMSEEEKATLVRLLRRVVENLAATGDEGGSGAAGA